MTETPGKTTSSTNCRSGCAFDTAALWVGRAVLGTAAAIFGWLMRVVKRVVPIAAPAFVGPVLDGPLRRALYPPEEVVAMGVAPGDTVLELGCGPGTYTIEAARRAMPGGRVWYVLTFTKPSDARETA